MLTPSPTPDPLQMGRLAQRGINTTLQGSTRLTSTFVIPDSLDQLNHPELTDHLFDLIVQNNVSPESHFQRAVYIFHVPPQLVSVGAIAEGDTNRVTWSLDASTTGSRFRVARQTFHCGALERTETL